MKYLVLLAMMLPAFSQKILKVKDDNVLISNDDIELESGKKYYLETDSGESLIGVYTNGSSDSGYVARILEGDLSEGDRITSHRKKKISGGSMAMGPYKKFSFGIHAGVNLTGTNTSCEDVTAGSCPATDSSTDAGLGFQGGLNLQYHFSQKLALNAKISYNIHKFSSELATPTGAATTGPFETQGEYSTISFQPTIKYYIMNALFASTGVRVHMPMGFTSKGVDTSNGEIIPNSEVDILGLDDAQLATAGLAKPGMYLDIPLNIGASFNLGKIKLEPNFTYYFPISAILESDSTAFNQTAKLSSMAFNLDVLF